MKQGQTLQKALESIASDGYRAGEVLRAFALLSACALAPRVKSPEHPMGSVSVREDECMAEARRWKPEHLNLFSDALAELVCAMENRPFADLFGELHQEWRADYDRKSGGEFYTPPELCKLLARMTLSKVDFPGDRPIDLLEPACGAGGMVLAAAEALVDEYKLSPLCVRATCIDIDRTACDICFVNLTLWGIPATVVHGNALTNETWAVWRNPFWDVAQPARKRKHLDDIAKTAQWFSSLIDEVLALEPREAAPEPAFVLDKRGQFAFDLEVMAA